MSKAFNKACPSGNNMTENNEDAPDIIYTDAVYSDKNGVLWQVSDVNDTDIELYPYDDQKRVYTREQFADELTKQ